MRKIFMIGLRKITFYFPSLVACLLKFFHVKNSQSMRHVRSIILRRQAGKLGKAMKDIGYQQNIKIMSNGDTYVESGGIYLDASATNRYFKKVDRGNEGFYQLDFLKEHHIKVDTVIDIGANFGEITLFFSRNFPDATVYSIEPSPDNLIFLKRNINCQQFKTSNIVLIEEAINDCGGKVDISCNMGSENSIVSDKNSKPLSAQQEKVTVNASTLTQILERYKIHNVDFLKVDIEGAEPLLENCIRNHGNKIKCVYIEFSCKNTKENYLRLLNAFFDVGFKCYLPERINDVLSCAEATGVFEENHVKGININFWFKQGF